MPLPGSPDRLAGAIHPFGRVHSGNPLPGHPDPWSHALPGQLRPGSLVLVGLVGLVVVVLVAVLAYGLAELRLAWLILGDDPDAALDAPNGGPVELAGVAEPDARTLRSPFTGTECLAYEYEVQQERHTNHGRTWERVASGRQAVPFRLRDDTGSVLIEPPGADFRLGRDARIAVAGGEHPPERIVRFIAADDRVDDQNRSIDLGPLELRTGKDRRYVERRLDVGEEVHVLGTARFDTSVAREAGQVNAAVGIDRDALDLGRIGWYWHRLAGPPFLVSDTSERGTAKRIATVGALATAGGAAGLAVLALVLG